MRDGHTSTEAARANPPGYMRHGTAGYELVARDTVIDAMREVLDEHGSLYDWASRRPQPRALKGRAPVYVATLPRTDAVLAVRHAWHGGMLAPVTGDRFRAPTRAPIELANSLRLEALGVRTTQLLGYVLYPAGPSLRRVDVATRFIPDAVDLGAVLAGLAPGITATQALPVVTGLLVTLARHGVLHPDLNVKNVLLFHDAREQLLAIPIDVDVVRFDADQDPDRVMDANLRRLVRSIRKWQRQFGIGTSDAMIDGFERGCREALRDASAR